MKKKILLFIGTALLFFAVTTMAQVPSYVPSNGLVAWYPFSGNANDLSGNGNNGTVSGATLTTDRFGNANSAYNFNGSSNYIQASLTTALNTSSISGITLSGWTNSISYTISSPQVIAGLFDASGSAYAILWGANGSNGFLQGECGASGVAASMIIYQLTSPLINTWYHVVMTCDLTSNISKLYINGIYQSQSNNVLIHPMLNKIIIGKWTSNWFQNGKLDDIGVWSRALTQAEISYLYSGCNLSITTNPTNQNVNVGNNAQFGLASSDTSATYHWQTDLGLGFQNISNAGQYSGATNDTLIVSNTTLTNNNQQFRCIVTSGSCVDTSTVATLSVINNVGINEASINNLYKVYPNPANSNINLEINKSLIGSIFTITDQIGKTVLSGILNTETSTIELGDLSGGIYLLSIGNNAKQTFKVIKK